MTKLKALARNPWFSRIVGALEARLSTTLLLGLIIWFVGPLVAIGGWKPLGWWPVTLLFALLPIAIVGGLWWWRRRAQARNNAALVDALAPAKRPDADRPELQTKLSEALGMLRSTKVGKGGAYIYQLPWYAIIGPSGAGKTTALLNSGLGFPTAVAGEYRALRGQPNTPNCDWWFTDEAVLIDTAGRYVTQDVDAARDAEGWKGFLDLLKRHRPLQPLNGIIVAVPAPDFADHVKMASHAENIRARLNEITTTLGIDLPIYLLVTKADLLSGFREYFARNTDAESEQVFGSTAPGTGSNDDSVLSGFDALVTSVSSRVVDRMQNESQLPLRGAIAAFPAQLASLRKPLADLLAALGQKTRYEGPARVRGVYLASGTQTGSPVDRILLSVGMPPSATEHAVGRGRSYFLKRFFSDLVFPEQGITGRNAGAERSQKLRYTVGLAAGVAALVVALGTWSYGYFKNMGLIRSVYATASAYSDAAGLSRGGTATPPEALAALNVLGKATADMGSASDFGLGLGQGGRLKGELDAIYGRDLQRRLTPILASLAENRMAADMNAPASLYDDLKSYLILGGRGPMLPEQILAWVQPAWLAGSRDPDAEVQAGDIARHAKALLDGSFTPVAVDGGRIDQARTVMRTQPAAVRVYGRLKSEAMAGGQPMWSARDHAGPQPEIFFAPGGAFAQGAGVPSLFTRTGYDKTFLPIIASGGKLFDEERWVVGDTGPAKSMNPVELSALKSDLERLYFAEFLSRWQGYLAAMQPKPVGSLADNIQRLRDASGPLSPLPPLMKAVAQATDMSRSAAQASATAGLTGGITGKLLGAAGVFPGGGGADDPRSSVVNAFAPLRLFVGIPPGGGPPPAGQPAPIDAMLTAMGQLADKLNVISALAGGGGEQGSAAGLEVRAGQPAGADRRVGAGADERHHQADGRRRQRRARRRAREPGRSGDRRQFRRCLHATRGALFSRADRGGERHQRRRFRPLLRAAGRVRQFRREGPQRLCRYQQARLGAAAERRRDRHDACGAALAAGGADRHPRLLRRRSEPAADRLSDRADGARRRQDGQAQHRRPVAQLRRQGGGAADVRLAGRRRRRDRVYGRRQHRAGSSHLAGHLGGVPDDEDRRGEGGGIADHRHRQPDPGRRTLRLSRPHLWRDQPVRGGSVREGGLPGERRRRRQVSLS